MTTSNHILVEVIFNIKTEENGLQFCTEKPCTVRQVYLKGTDMISTIKIHLLSLYVFHKNIPDF